MASFRDSGLLRDCRQFAGEGAKPVLRGFSVGLATFRSVVRLHGTGSGVRGRDSVSESSTLLRSGQGSGSGSFACDGWHSVVPRRCRRPPIKLGISCPAEPPGGERRSGVAVAPESELALSLRSRSLTLSVCLVNPSSGFTHSPSKGKLAGMRLSVLDLFSALCLKHCPCFGPELQELVIGP